MLQVNQFTGFGGGAARLTLEFGDSASASATSVSIPVAQRVAGNICVCAATGDSDDTPGLPTDFTNLANVIQGFGVRVSFKVLTGAETSVSSTLANRIIIAVFVPSETASSVAQAAAFNKEATGSNPSAQSVPASGYEVPSIVLGAIASTATAAFSTASPAFDDEISLNSLMLGYKIYNSDPQDHTIDMNDLGANMLISGALIATQ